MCLASRSASPDKVDYLQAVTFANAYVGPGCARYYLAVVFDGDAVALQCQRGNQAFERVAGIEAVKAAWLSIELQV
jgi:hypothetical protein